MYLKTIPKKLIFVVEIYSGIFGDMNAFRLIGWPCSNKAINGRDWDAGYSDFW